MSTLSPHPCEFGRPLPLPLPESGQPTPAARLAAVAELAYRLWKGNGFKAGTELDYWHEAEQQLPFSPAAGK